MAIVAQSAYGSVADGGLDPLWFYNGSASGARQAQAVDRIGAEADPLGGAFRVQRFTIQPGDFSVYGGNRCEVLSQAITLNEGQRGQLLTAVMIPSTFKSDASGWNSLMDFHYPNNGPAQSPFTLSIRNNNQLYVNIKGGPLSSDGTQGTVQIDQLLQVLTFGAYHTILIDLLQGSTVATGDCNIWIDGVLKFSGARPTMSSGVPNDVYIKQGFYSSAGSRTYAGTQSMWLKDTIWWKNSTPTEAYNYLIAQGGGAGDPGGGDPPPPPPTPDPENDAKPPNWVAGLYVRGAVLHGSSPNKQRCYKAQIQTTATITDFGAWIDAQINPGTENRIFIVFADAGGEPGAILGFTTQQNFTTAFGKQRILIPLTSPFAGLAGQYVWLGDLSWGSPNIADTRRNNVGEFRLMDRLGTLGPTQWDITADQNFAYELNYWLEGTPTSDFPKTPVIQDFTGASNGALSGTFTTPAQSLSTARIISAQMKGNNDGGGGAGTVTIDAISSGSVSGWGTETKAHTVAGTNRYILVAIAERFNSAITSVKYNNVSLTKVGGQDNSNLANVTFWELVAPATGTHDVVIVQSGSHDYNYTIISLTSVDQSTPSRTPVFGVGTASTSTVTATSATGEFVIDCHAIMNNTAGAFTMAVGAGQTSRTNLEVVSGGQGVRSGVSTEAGAASVVMSWTITGSSPNWTAGAISIKPSGGAGDGGGAALTAGITATTRENWGIIGSDPAPGQLELDFNMPAITATAGFTGYRLVADISAKTLTMKKWNGTTDTVIDVITVPTLTVGDGIGVRSVGTNHKVFYKDGAGNWVQVGSPTGYTDTTYNPSTAYIGWYFTRTTGGFSIVGGGGPSVQKARPLSVVSSGGWSPSTGTLVTTIDETSLDDADYDSSPVSPATPSVMEVKLGAITDPATNTGHVIRYRYKKNTTGGDQLDLTVNLMQGNTVIKTWTHTNISAVTTATQTLSGGEADSITDYADLRLRFSVVKA